MQVIATAGHVDHGKSTLLRALTGMDPDRWSEEKRRGMTIDLGFAWLRLPSGGRIAFVDVPGHERFVPNMLSGVGPVPAVLFIVAADEGWMPQSAEHLAVVDALGIGSGLLVITRSDLADPGPARAQALAAMRGSSLGSPPAVAVSAVTGDGLPELVAELDKLAQGLPVPDPGGPVRLWVDRAFTMTGSGTVVTGTLPEGTVHRGDELVVTPSMRPVRVRDIQTLGESAPEATGVARVALNLRGVTKDSLSRGMAIVQAGRWLPTDVVDVRVCADPEAAGQEVPGGEQAGGGLAGEAAPESAGGPAELAAMLPRTVTVHIGSARTVARVRPLSATIARLRLRDPLPLHCGDRILLRDPGVARPPRRGSTLTLGTHAAETTDSTDSTDSTDLDDAAEASADTSPGAGAGAAPAVREALPGTPSPNGISSAAVKGPAAHPVPGPAPAHASAARIAGAPGEAGWPGVAGAVVLDVAPPPLTRRGAAAAAARELATWPDQPGAAELLRRHGIMRATMLLAMGVHEHPEPVTGEWLVDPVRWNALAAELGEVLAAHAAREPLAPGLPVEAARSALSLPDRRLVTALARPPFRVTGGLIQLTPAAGGPSGSGLPEPVEAAIRILRADLAQTPFAAPDAERLRRLGLDVRATAAAARAGLLLRISDSIVLAPGADEAAAAILTGLPQPFTAADARQALNTTRRTAIPLLEYLDRAGVTERLPDDRRQVRPRPEVAPADATTAEAAGASTMTSG